MADERYAEYMEETPKSWVQGLYEESSTKKQTLGSVRKLDDDQEFIYVENGAANMVAGDTYQSEACDVANLANLAVTANAAIGAREISFTLGNSNTANVANAFADGFIYVNTGTGLGYKYKIKGHAAIAANANGTVALYDKVRVALTAASSKVSLMKHPCKDVVISAGPPTGSFIGIAQYVMTANYFGWIQRKGPSPANFEGTMVPGDICIRHETVAGAVGIGANGTSEEEYSIGIVLANNANDHYGLIDLKG